MRRKHRFRSLLTGPLALALVAVGAIALTSGPAKARVEPGTHYQLISALSGKAIDIEGASTEEGAPVVQWEPHDGANQQFRFVSSGDGYYRIIARHSGMALEVHDWNQDNGAEIVQWSDLDGENQQWRPIEHDDGTVTFVNRFSGKALDVWEHSTEDGARISQYDRTEADNQRWHLEPVNGTPPGDDCGTGAYDAEVTAAGGTWTARNGGQEVYTGGNMPAAIRAALDSLTAGRNTQESVVVRGSGSMSASESIDLPDHTAIDVCGTIDVTGNPTGDNAVLRGRHVNDVTIGHLSVTGSPYFGVFVRNGSDIHLGRIDLRLSGGLGVRIDNHADRSQPTTDVRIDEVYVSGTGNHGVETYGVDGLTIGSVTARDTAYSGLLLNDTINAEVGTVDAEGAGTGTGYAAFRMANRNGRVDAAYPTNVHVGEVIARGGGRGVFCVSESGGAVIDRVDIANTGNNAILIENCYNVTIASESGSVSGPGTIRLAARDEFADNRDITIRNLTVTDSALVESPCGQNTTFRNNELVNSTRDVC